MICVCPYCNGTGKVDYDNKISDFQDYLKLSRKKVDKIIKGMRLHSEEHDRLMKELLKSL